MNVTLKISYRFAILVPPQFNSPIQFQSQINLLADVNNLIVVRSRPRWLKLEISRLYDKILEACCTKERKSPLGLKIFSSTSQRIDVGSQERSQRERNRAEKIGRRFVSVTSGTFINSGRSTVLRWLAFRFRFRRRAQVEQVSVSTNADGAVTSTSESWLSTDP